jgi:DNA-binding CsgD family transcriptional regulator
MVAAERAVEKIAQLSGRPTDLATFWQDCTEVLGEVVSHFWTPCWYTLDPASLLITSHFHHGLAEFPAEWLANEYYNEDVYHLVDVAGSTSGIATLHEATGGDPQRSPRWHENMKMGGDQELIARLRTRSGEVWGMLGLYREPGAPLFDATEKKFLHAITPHLAEGARRALLIGEAAEPEYPDAPGLVILSDAKEIQSSTPGVDRWLAELPDGDWSAGRLPSAVLAVAGRARNGGRPAISRVLSRSGTWITLHGSILEPACVAVIIEAAHPARIYPLLMSVYKFTERERDIISLVLQGTSTTQIAQDLVMSANTVQQHLKSIFDKTGVRSRRDLVGKIFFTHYEPRFRDNERRAAANRPLRGGPA